MLDYIQAIIDFIEENFHPSHPASANLKMNTDQFLEFLFYTFPKDCISDYDLNEILISLNYKRHTYVVENYCEVEKGETTIYEVQKSLAIGWCFKSDLDLITREVEKME